MLRRTEGSTLQWYGQEGRGFKYRRRPQFNMPALTAGMTNPPFLPRCPPQAGSGRT